MFYWLVFFFFSIRRRHTRLSGDWSSDVCSSDLLGQSRPPRVVVESKAVRPPAVAEPPSSVWPEKRGPKRGHPPRRLPGSGNRSCVASTRASMPSAARQVREPRPGFSTAHRATAPALPQLRHPCRRLVLAKRSRPPVDSPAGLSSATHRLTRE